MTFKSEIKINKITTEFFGPDFIEVSWDVQPINPSGVYLFNVYRSAANSIGSAQLASQLQTSNQFLDYGVRRREGICDIWYWVSVLKQGVSGEDVYGPKHFGLAVDPKAEKIRRDEDLMLRRFIKNKSYFLIKRRFGQQCVCAKNTVPDLSCEICYGTGYVGGYYDKIESYVGLSIPASYHDDASRITEKFDVVNGWTTYGPSLHGGDLIFVAARDTMFIVKNVKKTVLNGCVLRQIFDMVEMPAGHPAYKLLTNVTMA
mgnify:CR=1 FL=1